MVSFYSAEIAVDRANHKILPNIQKQDCSPGFTARTYFTASLSRNAKTKQNLLLHVNGAREAVKIDLPFTVGMWETTKPVTIELKKGQNQFTFKREGGVKGVTIKDFILKPLSSR